MSKAAKSMLIFGIYLIGLGIVLVFTPKVASLVFGLQDTNGVWVRVARMLLLFLAFFCLQAARKELTEYMRWTVYTRSSVIIFFSAFVLLGLAKPILIIFGIIDLLAAIWTGMALRSSRPTNIGGATTGD